MRIAQATREHVWAHISAKNWPLQRHEYRLLLTETREGRVWVALDEREVPVAVGGLLAAGRAVPAAWLSVLPGTGPKFLGVALGIRRVLKAMGPAACFIRDDNAAGVRLGRLLGFDPKPLQFGAIREWRRV